METKYWNNIEILYNNENVENKINLDEVYYTSKNILFDSRYTAEINANKDKKIIVFLEDIDESNLLTVDEINKLLVDVKLKNFVVFVKDLKLYTKLLQIYENNNIWSWPIEYVNEEIKIVSTVNRILFNYSQSDVNEKFKLIENDLVAANITQLYEYPYLRSYLMLHLTYIYMKFGISNFTSKTPCEPKENVSKNHKINQQALGKKVAIFQKDRYVKTIEGEVYNPTVYTVETSTSDAAVFTFNERMVTKNEENVYTNFNEYRYFETKNYKKIKRKMSRNKDLKKYALLFNESLKKHTNYEINILDTFIETATCVEIENRFYTELFKRANYEKIVIVGWYFHGGKIKAAKNANVKVYEYQYAAVFDYTTTYILNDNMPSSILPDVFMMWDEYSVEMSHIPNAQVEAVGMKELKSENNNIPTADILFISQGPVQNQFATILKRIMEETNLTVNYKLHPTERTFGILRNILDTYPERINLLSIADIISDTLDKSEIVIGVFSSAVYQAIDNENKVIIYKADSYEYVSHLVEQKYAILAENNNIIDIIKNIDKYEFSKLDKFTSSEVKDTLNEIL